MSVGSSGVPISAGSVDAKLSVIFSSDWLLVNTMFLSPDEPFSTLDLSETVPEISTFKVGFGSPLSSFLIKFVYVPSSAAELIVGAVISTFKE